MSELGELVNQFTLDLNGEDEIALPAIELKELRNGVAVLKKKFDDWYIYIY